MSEFHSEDTENTIIPEQQTEDIPMQKEESPQVHHSKKKKHKKKRKNSKPDFNLHIVFLILILLIAALGIFKLVKWNKGKDSGYDPNAVTTEFDTEPEDYFVPLDSATASKQKDDGVTSILMLGNGAFAKGKGSEGVDGYLEKLTGGKVYNASFDNTFLSVKNTPFDENYPADAFSLYWVTSCMCLNDYTLLSDNARAWDGDLDAADTVEMLKGLDLSSIDVLCIMYDGADYTEKRLLTGPYDDTMAASCCGCLLQSLRQLRTSYPQMRIIVSSPAFACVEGNDGKLTPGSMMDLGQGTLPDYMIAYKNIAVTAGVSFVDHYFGTINEDNYKDYLEDDSFTLNKAGRELVAKRIASAIEY